MFLATCGLVIGTGSIVAGSATFSPVANVLTFLIAALLAIQYVRR